jgi:predicted AAA+ superfamily ATPase
MHTYLQPVDSVTKKTTTPSLSRGGVFEVDHWLRGGFPDSVLAANDALSLEWRRNFIRSYLERDVPT